MAPPPATNTATTNTAAPDAAASHATDGTNLETRLAAIAVLGEQGEFGKALGALMALRTAFPDRTGEIDPRISVIRSQRREALDLEYALSELTNSNPATVRVAGEKLTTGTETACIILRRAVRQAPDTVAGEAAVLLSETPDSNTAAIIVTRFMANPDTPARNAFLRALTSLVTTPGQLAAAVPLWPLIATDTNLNQRDVAAFFVAAAKATATGGSVDVAAFESGVDRPGAWSNLQNYVRSAMASSNESLRAWGTSMAAAADVLVPGIRASYYEGINFERLVTERLEPGIQLLQDYAPALPFPDGRRENFSVRWSGKLRITQAGRYSFRVSSDDGNRMWLAGKKLFDTWVSPTDQRADAELEPGLHAIVVEFEQGPGNWYLNASFTPPGGQERPLTNDVLWATP
jgi:hypothetical protein